MIYAALRARFSADKGLIPKPSKSRFYCVTGIKDNIEYDHFVRYGQVDKDRLDEIVSIILETVCSKRKTIRIAGDDYPAELVKAKFMKLSSSHIEFVFDCMKENTTKIRNIKQYLKAVLFNAPNTIDSYYTALVAHDMATGKI